MSHDTFAGMVTDSCLVGKTLYNIVFAIIKGAKMA